MKLAILASLVASAAAFAPAQQKASSTALNAFEDALGAQPPLGFFDPLGLVADGDEEKFERLRYVEIKHGRICMLGVLGYLVQEAGIRLPGAINYSGLDFSAVPNGFGALSTIGGAGIGQIVAFIGFLELAVMKDVTGESEFPGDFRNGFIDFGWDSFDESTKLSKRAIELNNGRAAQMGLLALMVHEKLGVSLIPDV
eukprot:CAMPEP_0113451000 /NCGR_PEP_ID=MMETSP0014_2-20120614/6117_1 /TAXON_ID=2857 /ORGANISM="Nitzschia sp." /LENGTH=197 /DNA_ID=CAMNT_0000342351 /DNA_START=114 /DNA_END=707 /DNA_ORIENTATION=+ /assembly_acc=CAM_ASM_000159